jgi:hypothetical protein
MNLRATMSYIRRRYVSDRVTGRACESAADHRVTREEAEMEGRTVHIKQLARLSYVEKLKYFSKTALS